MFVALWGYFLYQGVLDPLGGINSLWPLFGISNQLLAAVALCVGTTVIIKTGRARYAWVTALPLTWLVVVTLTAGWQKLLSPNPALGFLAKARSLASALASGTLPAGRTAADVRRMIFNERLDAVVAGAFMLAVVIVLVASMLEWSAVIRGKKPAVSSEIPAEYAAEPRIALAGD